MNHPTQLIDEMRRRQSELQIAVNRQQEDLAASMTELNAVKRAVRAYEDVMNPPSKTAKRPLLITGPIATAPAEPLPAIKPRRGRASSAKAIGSKGGHARAAAMTSEQRREAGKRGAAVRWARQRERDAAQAMP